MIFLTLSIREKQWVCHRTDAWIGVSHRFPALLAIEDGVDVYASGHSCELVHTDIEEYRDVVALLPRFDGLWSCVALDMLLKIKTSIPLSEILSLP